MRNKFKWFKFYFCYKEIFEKVSLFSCKKLILALIQYSYSDSTENLKLNKKTMILFEQLKTVIDQERKKSVYNGYKGAKRRWNDNGYNKNRGTIKNNRGSIQ